MDDRTFGERVSDMVARFGSSWYFILSGAGIITAWVTLNVVTVLFDPYPFILLNLFLSLIAAFQAPFILMSQRRCEYKQDLIYRALFREVKELVQANLNLEYEMLDRGKRLERNLRRIWRRLK